MNCHPVVILDLPDDIGYIKPKSNSETVPVADVKKVVSELYDELNLTEVHSTDVSEEEQNYFIGVGVGIQLAINKTNGILPK